uniref:Ig-like domain-containing protein n=1 Tax=Sparus aurata TaxID=8175 RepID=A0A671US55_SPAAU
MNNDNKIAYIFVYYRIVVIVPTKEHDILSVSDDNWLYQKLLVSFKWKKNAHNVPGSTDWKPESIGNKFSAVSILNVNNTDWDNRDVYKCEVTHAGTQYTKKASKGTDPLQSLCNTVVL